MYVLQFSSRRQRTLQHGFKVELPSLVLTKCLGQAGILDWTTLPKRLVYVIPVYAWWGVEEI
jgi:hypothetical protein